MLLDAAQLLTVAGREYAIVTYSDEMVRQYMKRQQIEERIDVHGHDAVLTGLLVHLVVVGDPAVGDIEYPGVLGLAKRQSRAGDGHTEGIAPDVFEHLTDSFGRGLCMNDPWLFKAFLTDVFWDGNSLFLQPACQQTHETPAESGTHGSHREEERCTPASMNLVPYSLHINASTGYDAMNMGVVEQIRAPRMEDGSHAGCEPLLGSKSINGGPRSLEHTVVELPLISHRDGMQTIGQREYDMEIFDRDNLFPAELYPLLALLVLAFGAMSVPAAVVADMYVTALGTHLYMSAKGAGAALRHVAEGSFDRRYDMMFAQELTTVAPDNLTDVETSPHFFLGGKMVSIRRTCFIGSMSAT